jgi:hypothetical protein
MADERWKPRRQRISRSMTWLKLRTMPPRRPSRSCLRTNSPPSFALAREKVG